MNVLSLYLRPHLLYETRLIHKDTNLPNNSYLIYQFRLIYSDMSFETYVNENTLYQCSFWKDKAISTHIVGFV